MAIIYSYPVVTPTTDDYVLGTDATAADKPTKNFTIQSIVDIVSGGAAGLGAVLAISSDASDPTTGLNQSASNFLNVQGTGTFTAATFLDGTMSITGGIGTGFSSITSTDFVGNLTGIVQAGSSIAGLAGGTDAQNVLGVTQNVGDNSTRLATTAYVMAKVDPSVLTFLGTTGGNQTVNLAAQTLSLLGTTSEIKTVSSAQTLTISLADGAFGSGTELILPDGASATTQAATDNTTKVATTAFVNTEDDAQDLDFTGDSGTSSVLLNSETLDFEGTALQVTTAVTAQKVKFTLPTNVTIGGTFTGTTFAGDLLGTVNTATTGVTQSAGDDSTLIATTAYVDNAAGAKTLDYAGDATGPFALNLSTDDLEFNGDSNITVTAAAVAATKGIVTIDLNNDVTISGTMQAGTLSDGTFSGTAGTYTGGVSITSTTFVGALTGNADSATALAATGNIGFGGDVTLASAAPSATYTSGGSITFNLGISDTVVNEKLLTNLSTATAQTITATDSIVEAFGYLQATVTGLPSGLDYIGTWDARNAAERGSGSDGGDPDLRTAGLQVPGHYYIVATAGSATPNGAATTPNEWKVGDWVMRADATINEWQKIDNTSTINGTGASPKVALWTGTQTLGTGVIEDNGSNLVTIGNSADLHVEGDLDIDLTSNFDGVSTFQAKTNMKLGIEVDGAAGSAGQVLTSGAGSAAVMSWTTPTTGTVTSVALTETGDALTITGSPITSSGTLNIAGAGASTDYINGELDLVAFPTLDNYVSWTLAGDSGPSQTISSTNTATMAGGTYISTVASATDTLTITHDATTRSDSTSSDTPAFGATFEAVSSVTTNSTGHVTAIDVATVTIPAAPFDNYDYWTLAGDSGVNQTISSTNTATIAGGTGIDTVGSATDTLTINFNGTFPAAHGTQWTLPVWSTTTGLGDSMITQNSTGTYMNTVGGMRFQETIGVASGTNTISGDTPGISVGTYSGGGHINIGSQSLTSAQTAGSIAMNQGIHSWKGEFQNSAKTIFRIANQTSGTTHATGITARVMLTTGKTGVSNSDFAAVWDIACIVGSAPVYNKTIDSGTGYVTVLIDQYNTANFDGFNFKINWGAGTVSNYFCYVEFSGDDLLLEVEP